MRLSRREHFQLDVASLVVFNSSSKEEGQLHYARTEKEGTLVILTRLHEGPSALSGQAQRLLV